MTEELPHIRCLECGKPIAQLWNRYQNLLADRVKPEDALTQLGLTRYCCRMWMQSPFKVPIRSERQIDPRDTGYDQQAPTLTMAAAPQQLLAPLQAMTNQQPVQKQTTGYTVVPLTDTGMGMIELPPIPEVPLLPLPYISNTEDETNVLKPITRTYEAW